MGDSCGMYVVMRASSNPNRDEWTNYGLLVYGADGVKVYARVDYARAMSRGDLDPDLAAAARDFRAGRVVAEDLVVACVGAGHLTTGEAMNRDW